MKRRSNHFHRDRASVLGTYCVLELSFLLSCPRGPRSQRIRRSSSPRQMLGGAEGAEGVVGNPALPSSVSRGGCLWGWSPVCGCSALIFPALCHENGFLPQSVPNVLTRALPRPAVSFHLDQTDPNKSWLSGKGEFTGHFSEDVFPVEISQSAANVIYKKVS